MNKVILMGRLTKDVELKRSGDTVIGKFTIAVDRRNKNKDTDFINCVAWNRTAEFINRYFSKGNMIAVVGELRTGSYEKSDGSKAYITEVVVNETFFTGEKREQAEAPSAPSDDFSDFTYTNERMSWDE